MSRFDSRLFRIEAALGAKAQPGCPMCHGKPGMVFVAVDPDHPDIEPELPYPRDCEFCGRRVVEMVIEIARQADPAEI